LGNAAALKSRTCKVIKTDYLQAAEGSMTSLIEDVKIRQFHQQVQFESTNYDEILGTEKVIITCIFVGSK
jgi:hypothetical protein